MNRSQFLATLALLGLFVPRAFGNRPINRAGAAYEVDCDQPGQTIGAVLAAIANGPNGGRATIDIHGTCKENLFIQYLDRVTLIGHDGATIQDASNGNEATVVVADSSYIDLQSLIIDGGSSGVFCIEMSTCRMENDIVQNAAIAGVHIARSSTIMLSTTLQNNGVNGIEVVNGGLLLGDHNTITGNANQGVAVTGANLTSSSDIIQHNGRNGIRASNNATLRLADETITNNGANGIRLESASTLAFTDGTGTTISGNGGNGMLLLDQVNVAFSGLDNVSGNTGQPDVFCNGLYWIATLVDTIGGTTNCTQQTRAKGKK